MSDDDFLKKADLKSISMTFEDDDELYTGNTSTYTNFPPETEYSGSFSFNAEEGMDKAFVNHLYGRCGTEIPDDSATATDDPNDSLRFMMSKYAKPRGWREDRENEPDLPGEPAFSFPKCPNCGEEVAGIERNIERGDDWYCSIHCLNEVLNDEG